MRIKNILSVAAFSTAFIASTAFAGLFVEKSEVLPIIAVVETRYDSQPTSCFKHIEKSATARRISKTLKQDIGNGRERDSSLYRIDGGFVSPFSSSSFDEYSGVIGEYADNSGSIEDEGMPKEFQTAWREHMKAWRDYADFLESMKDASNRDTLGEESFETLDGAYNTEINQTWYEVLRVADEYGANMN